MSERMNITEFHIFREYFRNICGLYFEEDKYPRVAKTIGTRMSELGIGHFREYQLMLTSSPGSSCELATLADRLTVGETHFFRNKDHWRALEECVLPWILERNAITGRSRIRIWSAGCSTGEEAYTASIVLNRRLQDLARWSIEIIGTDLSPTAIAKARKAVFTENSFRGVPQEIRREYFEPVETGCFSPRADIREMVRFQEMNLLDGTAMSQMCEFDVIFCRNVLIYFEASGIERVMAHFHRSLRSGCYLFLGHAESAHGDSPAFDNLNVCNTFFYRSVPCSASTAGRFDTSPRPISEPGTQAAPFGLIETHRPDVEQRLRTTARVDENKSPVHIPPGEPSMDDLRARAIEHLCAEEVVAARRAFEEILVREENDSDGLLGLALLLAGSGNSEAALVYCDRVLLEKPMSAEAYCVMALLHEGQGENGMAQRELERAVYLDERFSIAHFRLATLHNRAQRQDAATREFSNALKALPEDDEQRVQLYSGGFSKEIVAQICRQRLGVESASIQGEGIRE